MTNYSERLDEALLMLTNAAYAKGNEDPRQVLSGVPRVTTADTKQSLTSLIKELVAEANPGKHIVQEDSDIYDDYDHDREQLRHELQENNINIGHNSAIDLYEQNLLKALEEL